MATSLEERLLVSEECDLKRRILIETKISWRIAFPSMLFRVSSFAIVLVTQIFLGHLGEVNLAAYALVQTIFLRFANGILLGMSIATETLCGQAFGAGHYHMMGIYLQRSWIVDIVTATILLPIFIFGAPILKLLGQDEAIAKVGGDISLWLIPFLYYFIFSFTIQMYLQAQLKNMIIGWLSTGSLLLHVLLSWIFVYIFDFGVAGAMISMNIAGWLVVIGEFVYIFGGWCPTTWKGFTKAAFHDILPVIKLSVSSGVMISLELWYFSVLVLLAGLMKNATVAISAFSICLNVSVFVLMIGLGFLAAACVRVSNELGRGDAKAAKFSIKVVLTTSTCIGLLFFVLCLAFDQELSYLFTSSKAIAESVSNLSLLLAFSVLLYSVQPVLTGIAIGAGFQTVVAYINLASYYLIGVPAGALLGYVADLGIKGLWLGLLGGVVIQTLVLAYVVWRTDWDEQVVKTSQRLNRMFLEPSEVESYYIQNSPRARLN